MPDETRLLDLLAEWNDQRQLGRDPTPRDLCPDDTALQEQLRERIARVKGVVAAIDPSAETVTAPAERLPTAPPGYEILGLIDRGSFGVVYRARQLRLNRVVALKFLLGGPHASPERLERFRREAEAIARLRHPNIIQIFESGEHQGLAFLALEFAEGGSLARRLASGPLAAAEAARVAEETANGLAAVHVGQIVHRDLKPANVLLTASGDLRVADFGLARLVDATDGQTLTGLPLGTPSYMAPEQAAGDAKRVGPAADVWALGAILYECLTGRPPFRGSNREETMLLVLEQDPVAPRSLRPDVPRDLETVCLKCLEKEPARRYPDAASLAEDLRRFRAAEPILATPPPVWRQAWRFAARHRTGVGAASAAVVAASFLVAMLVAKERERLATVERDNAELRARDAERDRAVAERVRDAADRIIRGDDFAAAARLYDEALAAGRPGDGAIRLERAKAVLFATDALDDRARNDLTVLQDVSDSALRARALLWSGAMTVTADPAAAVALIRRAADLGLPEADGSSNFAAALLSTESGSAIKELRNAVERDPAHMLAWEHLGMTLLMTGQKRELRDVLLVARARFPANPHLLMVRGLLDAAEGRRAEAEAAAGEIGRRLGARRAASYRATVEAFSLARTAFEEPGTFDNPFAMAGKLLPAMVKVLNAPGPPSGAAGPTTRLPLLPFQAGQIATVAGLLRQDNALKLWLNPQAALAQVLNTLGPMDQSVTDSALYYLHGGRFVLVDRDLRKAEAAYSRAADGESLFRVQPQSRTFAARTAFLYSLENAADAGLFRQRAAHHVRALVAAGEYPPDLPDLEQAGWVAIRTNEWEAARAIGLQLTSKFSNQMKAWHVLAAAEHALGNGGAAVKAMRMGLEKAKTDDEKKLARSELATFEAALRNSTDELLSSPGAGGQ